MSRTLQGHHTKLNKKTESPTVGSRGLQQLYCAVQSRSPNHCRTTTEKVQSSARDGTSSATVHYINTEVQYINCVWRLRPLVLHKVLLCKDRTAVCSRWPFYCFEPLPWFYEWWTSRAGVAWLADDSRGRGCRHGSASKQLQRWIMNQSQQQLVCMYG